jgi:hypothetical protein
LYVFLRFGYTKIVYPIFFIKTKIKGGMMSIMKDIKESKSFRLVIGVGLGIWISPYLVQNQPLSHDIKHSLSDDMKGFLIANLNVQKSQDSPATVVDCNQTNAIPNTRLAPIATDEGMKAPAWTPPDNPTQNPTNTGEDDKSPDNILIDDAEDVPEGEEQETAIVEDDSIPVAINWPGYTTGQTMPQEVVDTSNGQVGSTTPSYPKASVDDVLPPEDNNTGSFNVVIQRQKKGS